MLCPHFGECGGCSQQDSPYPEQLARKRAYVQELLRRALGGRAPLVLPVAGMATSADGAPWGFRHKVSFVFGPGPRGRGRHQGSRPVRAVAETRPHTQVLKPFMKAVSRPVRAVAETRPHTQVLKPFLEMGHFARNSNRIVPVDECPVHSPRGNRIAFAVRDALTNAGITGAGPDLAGIARHLIVRTTADERQAVAMLVVTRNDKRLRAPVRAVMAGTDAPDGFLINVHDRPGPLMVGRETLLVSGRGQVRETGVHPGTAYLISPTAFFQTNVHAAGLLLDEVLASAPSGRALRVLDVYSGSGLFGLPLAQRGHAVTMIEDNAQAMKDAGDNLRTNRIPATQVRLMCERAEVALTENRSRGPAIRNVNLAVVDPPRDGCPPVVIETLFRTIRPDRVVYVSCNPEALARELPAIMAAGYQPERVLPVDMFPHTDHVEVVVTLRRT
jgi:23S rRNA (uracil1939-C5)-methyltransferase